ncbi:tetratricopeptide repeat protein [Streptomyces sp. WM6378]|uniref:tetratricopeptide repeat protein n=1 Tax=Streptomyces sp. WM6378 TaxID=1415557 RepID=UPI0006AD912D|nr:tetratricopeptide repeat protein [Streptomyces sp. WM6378]KOU48500.1 hypothetical protein ADK54_11570 [Streptomyces sp. WM6378]
MAIGYSEATADLGMRGRALCDPDTDAQDHCHFTAKAASTLVPLGRYVVHRSQLLHNRARVRYALGRLDEAYADFTELIAWDPYYVEYHVDRANLCRRRGDLAGALAGYDRVVRVSAPMPELFHNRGDVRAEAGDVEGARADFTRALELEPDELGTGSRASPC